MPEVLTRSGATLFVIEYPPAGRMLGSFFALFAVGETVGTAGSTRCASGPRGVTGAGVMMGAGGNGVAGG